MRSIPHAPTEAVPTRGSTRLSTHRVARLAECLIAGRTRQETADEIGASVSSVRRWSRSPLVLAEIERLTSQTNETRAVDVLVRLMDSDDDRVALAAATEVLRRGIQATPVEQTSHDQQPPEPPPGFAVVALESQWRQP
jgi:hypothetical protein